jgi:hypothetical protein
MCYYSKAKFICLPHLMLLLLLLEFIYLTTRTCQMTCAVLWVLNHENTTLVKYNISSFF